MKKNATHATALACLLQDVLNRRCCSKQTGSSSTKETIAHHFFVSGIGQKKTVDASQNLWRRRNVKTKQQTFVNGLLGFVLKRYTPLEARVCAHNNYRRLPIDMGNSICCSLIYFWVPSSCFLHIDQPLSEGK